MSPFTDWLAETYDAFDPYDPHLWFTFLCLGLFAVALRVEQQSGWFSDRDKPLKQSTPAPATSSNPTLPKPAATKKEMASPFAIDPDLKLDPPKEDLYTVDQLKLFDGSDPAKPIYVAIKGSIFDVSRKRDMYGPGKGYNVFAGKDGSKGLGMSSLNPEDAISDYSALDEKDRKTLDQWYSFFEKRYNIIGKVKL